MMKQATDAAAAAANDDDDVLIATDAVVRRVTYIHTSLCDVMCRPLTINRSIRGTDVLLISRVA